MAELLQHLLNGLVLGGTYALLGIGLTLIFGLMNVVNFAHGEFYTLGAYAAFAALALAGAPFFAALLLAIAAGAVLGWLCEVTLLRPLHLGLHAGLTLLGKQIVIELLSGIVVAGQQLILLFDSGAERNPALEGANLLLQALLFAGRLRHRFAVLMHLQP